MAYYVKFMRGTPKAYEILQVKDQDTLYFIAEKDAVTGRLYLGDKEIICDNNSNGVSYLKDLLDVSLPDNIGELLDGQVLTYDVATESWVARTPEAVAEVKFDNNQFETNDAGELSILNFANAPSGAQLTKSADGSLIWVLPDETTVEGLGEAVNTLRSDVDSLTTKFENYDTSDEVDAKISEAIAEVNHLTYKIVNSIEEIDVNANDADRYIYLVKNGDVYDEYMVINNKLEKVGDWAVSLDNYATKEEVAAIDTKVTDLTSQLNTLKTDVSNNQSSITSIETTVNDLSTSLTSVSSNVTDLTTSLNIVQQTVASHDTKLQTLEAALANKVETSVYNEKMQLIDTDLEELKSAMTWNDLSE